MSIETVELAQAPPAVEVSDVSYIYSNAAGPVLKNLTWWFFLAGRRLQIGTE